MLILFGSFVYFVAIGVVQSKGHDTNIVERLLALENTVERQNNFLDLQGVLIKELKDTLALQQLNILELKDTVASQQHDIAELKDTVALQQKGIADLKGEVSSEQKNNAELENTVTSKQHKEKTTKRHTFKEVNSSQKRFVLDAIETVAFEATITAGKLNQHTHIHDRIVFDGVSLNVGTSYHSGNGTFVAPVGGIYIFSTSVMMQGASTQDLNMHVVLEKNGAEIAGAFAYNQGAYEHSSVTAAMDLQPGDSVYVSVERHNDITFYGDRLTSFMGFLLFPF